MKEYLYNTSFDPLLCMAEAFLHFNTRDEIERQKR